MRPDLRKSTGYPTKAAPEKPWPPLPRASPTSSPTPTTLAPEAATLATPATRATNAAAIATRQARPPTNDKDAVPRIHGARLVARSNAWAFGHPSNARPKPPLLSLSRQARQPATLLSQPARSHCTAPRILARSLARLPASATGGAHSRSRALSPLLLLVRSPFRTLVACLLRSVGWSVAHSLARQATTRRGQRALFVPLCRLPPTLCSLLSLPQRGGSTVANGCSTTVSATQLQRTSSLSLLSPSLSARVCGCLLCNRWVGRLSAGVDTRLVCGREIYYVQPTRTKHHVGAMRCRMRTRPTVSLAPTVLVQRNRCFSRGCNIHTP